MTLTLPKITDKQQSILTLLYRFRFLNRTQIQTILKHKYPKRINDWLKDLTEKQYIGKIYSNKIGENTKPAIYYIGPNGIKKFRELKYPLAQIKRLYREKERSDDFIKKHLLIADICLNLQNKSSEKIKHAALTGSDFSNPDSNYSFLADLNPDLIIKRTSEGKEQYQILEILEPTLPRYSIKKRVRSYFEMYFSNQWEDEAKSSFPEILFICPTLETLMYSKKMTKRLWEENQNPDLLIKFALEKEILRIE